MTFPVYIHIFGWTLHPHIVFETLAYFLGFRVYQVLKYRRGDVIDSATRWSVIAAAAAGAAIGSKILYWFEDPWQTLERWNDPIYLMAGKTIVGGVLGGFIGVELMKHAIGEKTRTGDLFAAPIAFAACIGRIGCFLTGLSDNTYGTATSLPWGVDFGDGISRHPTQLYESLFCLCLGVGLLWYQRKPRVNGDAFKLFMVWYMSFRLLVDFIKPGVPLLGLTGIQWACVFTLFYYINDILRWCFPGEGPFDVPLRRNVGLRIQSYFEMARLVIVIGGSILLLIVAGCGIALWPMFGLFTKVNTSYVWLTQLGWFVLLACLGMIANRASQARYKKEKEEFERQKREGLIAPDARFRVRK